MDTRQGGKGESVRKSTLHRYHAASTNHALLDDGKCAWGLILVTVRARARYNLCPTEQDKIPFADGFSANASKEWGLPATKRRSQPKMKQENTICRHLTDVKKSGSSATNRVPRAR